MNIKKVIYTCITGGYDNLSQHRYTNKDWDYICFTDNKDLIEQKQIGHWQILPIQFDKLDNVRNARWHKTHSHILLSNYDYSIWIDGNIEIRGSFLFKQVEKCIKENRLISIPIHPQRDCVYEEINAVLQSRKDGSSIIMSQKEFLLDKNMPTKIGLNETNIIFRQHKDSLIIKMMENWFDLIEKFSRRDQLSFNYILWKSGYKMKNLTDNQSDIRKNKNNFVFRSGVSHSEKPKMKTLSIIVPVYNALEDTKQCLESIECSNLSENVDILIINDKSEKETTDWLKDFIKDKNRYKLLENKENLGFVKTCNKGMKQATGDIIILLNSDTMIPKNFEERVLCCFNAELEIGVASPLASSSGLWDLPIKKGLSYDEMDKEIANKFKGYYPPLLCPEGFCFCIRKDVLNQIGLLDEIYGRGYCEETDLSLRALNNNWRIVLIADLYVYHKRHASFGSKTRQEQIEKNKVVLWGRYKGLYDEQNKKIEMAKLKQKIKYNIYNSTKKAHLSILVKKKKYLGGIFKKKSYLDGKRKFYFCGIKLFSFKKRQLH